MLTLPEIKYRIGADSSQFLPVAGKWLLISLKHFKKPTIVASIPNGEENRIALARMNNKSGQVLHLPVHSCVQCTPTSQGTRMHTHKPTHAPTDNSRESINSNKKAAASQGKSNASETTTKPLYC